MRPKSRVGSLNVFNVSSSDSSECSSTQTEITIASTAHHARCVAAYADAIERAFGADVNYGQAVKFYEAETGGPVRYSPPKVVDMERTVVAGNPDEGHISNSIIERQNLTMRMSMRRFTRLTNGFSKKVENMRAAVALHFTHYNFVRQHKTLRMTPAMAAGVERSMWSLHELVERTT